MEISIVIRGVRKSRGFSNQNEIMTRYRLRNRRLVLLRHFLPFVVSMQWMIQKCEGTYTNKNRKKKTLLIQYSYQQLQISM
jgi:hypothetical protein